MKQLRPLFAMVLLPLVCLLGGCSGPPDAGVLLREAKSEAEGMKSCSADLTQTLVYTADGVRHARSSSDRVLYHAQPFALRDAQTVQNDGGSAESETYTVAEDGGLRFYGRTDGVWRKTDAGGLDTAPGAQVDVLRLLDGVQGQTYVRETVLDSRRVHKLELKLSRETLRSPVEAVASATGMTGGSRTVVQTLLESAPDLYGYCYIDAETGRVVRVEADLTEAADRIFQTIDGGGVSVRVSKCEISGTIAKIDAAEAVVLPKEAKNAPSVQAYG